MSRYRCEPFFVLSLVSLVLLGNLACKSWGPKPNTPEPKTFDTHEEAASSHIAVLSVERWEDAKDSFQPDFKLTEAQALDKSLAATRTIEEQFLDSLQVALRLRAAETGSLGAGSSTGGGGTTDTGDDGGDGGDDGGDGGGDDGGAGGGDDGGGDGGGNDLLDPSTLELLDPTVTEPGGTRPQQSVLNKDLSTDPMLDYLAATALYQEVQMLNRYVDHAVQKTGYEPYLVRLQVSLLPRARFEPYDAYVWFSFFTGDGSPSVTPRVVDTIAQTPQVRIQALAEEMTQISRSFDDQVSNQAFDAEDLNRWIQELESTIKEPPTQQEVEALLRTQEDPIETLQTELPTTLTELQERWKTCRSLAESLMPLAADEQTALPALWIAAHMGSGPLFLRDLQKVADAREKLEDNPNGGELLGICRDIADQAEAFLSPEPPKAQAPIVVPLLVTDNLESTLRSRAIDRIRQFAFGLGFLLQNLGGDANITKTQRGLQTILGQDFNSLLTVARLSDNSYGVRLGAMQQVGTSYSTIPRTHNLTLLLLVPQRREEQEPCPGPYDYPTVQLISQTQLFHAIDGTELPERSASAVRTRLLEVAERYCAYGIDCTRAQIKRLPGESRSAYELRLSNSEQELLKFLGLAQQNQSQAFLLALRHNTLFVGGQAPKDFPWQNFWLDLTSVMVGSRQASTSFDLPRCRPPRFPCAQTALVLDDGKAAGVVLRQGAKLRADRLKAHLACPGVSGLAATKIEVSDAGATATLTFPSPKLWGLDVEACTALNLACATCRLPQACPPVSQPQAGPGVYPVLGKHKPAEKDEEKAKVALRVPTKLMRADRRGLGSVTFEIETQTGFDPKKHRAQFNIQGADLVSWQVEPTDAAGSLSPASRRLEKSGVVTVHLRNLLPQSAVKIELSEVTLKAATKTKKKDELKSVASHELTVVPDEPDCCGRRTSTAPAGTGGGS